MLSIGALDQTVSSELKKSIENDGFEGVMKIVSGQLLIGLGLMLLAGDIPSRHRQRVSDIMEWDLLSPLIISRRSRQSVSKSLPLIEEVSKLRVA